MPAARFESAGERGKTTMSQNIFAQKIAEFSLENIPPEVLHEAKRCLITYLGSAICAHREDAVRIIEDTARALNSASQATIIGTGRKLDMQFAAMCNGTSGTMYDFDDTMVDTILHPSCPVFPALLALGENAVLSGDKMLRCFVLGVEVEERIALYLGKKGHFDYGWHATGTAGTFGAAAAVGKAIGLTETEMAYAMGLVCSQAAGNRANLSTDAKALHAGKAAANGLLTAMFAKRGMNSSLSALDSEKGFGFLYSASPDYEFLHEDWSGYQIMKNTYKPYPCGLVNFPAIDAAIRMYRRGIHAEDIAKIELDANYLAIDVCGHRQQPGNYIEAKASLHHGVAMGLLRGRAGLKEYTDEAVRDEAAAALRGKITVIQNPDIEIEEAGLTVTLNNGEVFTEHVDKKTSSVGSALSDRTMEEKFRGMTEDYLSKERQDKLIEAIWNLDKEDSISKIIEYSASDLDT